MLLVGLAIVTSLSAHASHSQSALLNCLGQRSTLSVHLSCADVFGVGFFIFDSFVLSCQIFAVSGRLMFSAALRRSLRKLTSKQLNITVISNSAFFWIVFKTVCQCELWKFIHSFISDKFVFIKYIYLNKINCFFLLFFFLLQTKCEIRQSAGAKNVEIINEKNKFNKIDVSTLKNNGI